MSFGKEHDHKNLNDQHIRTEHEGHTIIEIFKCGCGCGMIRKDYFDFAGTKYEDGE